MKKIVLLIILLAAILAGCADAQNASTDTYLEIIGTHQDEIHRVLGEPSGMLSGLYGDIYQLKNGTDIVIYYDNETKQVIGIRVLNSEDKLMFSME